MFGDQFRWDCAAAAREAPSYVEGLELAGDGREVRVFDIDDTALNNPLLCRHGVRVRPLARAPNIREETWSWMRA
jgi:hypothetical protein